MFMASISKSERQLGKSGIGVILAVLVVIVIGVVYFALRNTDSGQPTVESVQLDDDTVMRMSAEPPPRDASVRELTSEDRSMIAGLLYDREGELFDVTEGTATGSVMSTYQDGTYYLHAEMDGLPNPSTFGEGYYYEGWLVRRNGLHVLSTGVVEVDSTGHAENSYVSGQDWYDHDYFVLTIEPNDGDPAPADHVLEGKMVAK